MDPLGIGLIVCGLVITFLLLIFFPKPKRFYLIQEVDPQLLLLQDNWKELRDLHDKQIDLEINKISPGAYYSAQLLTPRQEINYCGKLKDNTALCCMLALKLPPGDKLSVWCDGKTRFFREGELVILDASRGYLLQNKHKKKEAEVLTVNIQRPEKFPLGFATL